MIFLDTSYLIALIAERDEYNEKALDIRNTFYGSNFLTSELILAEFLDHFSAHGSFWRKFASETVLGFERNPKTKIIPLAQISFANAFTLYRRRQDKGYSFTDCSSMLIMKEKRIKNILTTDHHFLQEGFHAPMLSD